MTVESLGRTTPTRVWALKVLSDGTLVSGDSLGHVQFWDGKTGTLLQSFEQNENKADTLAIVVTPDEDRVFASGIDSRVICIERPKQHSIQQEPPRWILTHAQRPHTHDVKALVICRMHDASGGLVPTAEPHVMLCSGGVDTKICTFRVQDFRSNRPRTWFPWPSPASPISIARAARILLFRREGSMELHKLGSTSGAPSLPVILEDRKTCLGSIDIKSSHNLMCSDISQDGKYVIASTGTTLLMFEIGYTESEDGTLGFTPKQLSLSNKLKAPCVVAKFAASDTVVCVGMDGCVRIVKINRAADEDTPTVIEIDAVTVETTGVNTSFPVHTVAVSQDGKFFATIRSGIGSGVLTIFALQNDKIHQLWSLSALEAPIANAAFLSGSRPQLAVACSNFAMYVFNVHERRLSEWSEKNGFPVSPKLPYELTKHLDFPTCVLTNEKHPEKFIVVSVWRTLSMTMQDLYFRYAG
jgi:U3 small nucleolar RNA-associated protein 4